MTTFKRYGTLVPMILSAAWFGHDPSYEPVITFLVALGGYITLDLIRPFQPAQSIPAAIPMRELKKIGEIDFDYLPEDLTQHGWALGLEGLEKVPPTFSRPSDVPSGRALQIDSSSRYYLDYAVNPAERLTDVVRLSVKTTAQALSTFYFLVTVETANGAQSRSVWISHKVGRQKPSKVNRKEWLVYIDGRPEGNGWIAAELQLRREVAATFGTEGWVLRDLLAIRVRGSISVSPIEMFRHVHEDVAAVRPHKECLP